MTSQERLAELKRKREGYVASSKENNMYEGTKKILTDMYPDTAHFIYELLQNAEDMNATSVSFALRDDRLVFTHNGTKRDFVIEDIDAITSIGNNSLKRDDKTSIGKFGVGFKAVYSYTQTPEIHSGEYSFKIVDMFVPTDEGVEQKSKTGETQFVFPFDHKTKSKEQAQKEIKEGLVQLDENSILFLKNIHQIVFSLPDKTRGGVKLEDIDDNLKRIIKVDAKNGKRTSTYWYKFTKQCNISSSGEFITCPVSIAYKMNVENGDKGGTINADCSLKGNVCIYFPAAKEDSHLHFHINAPFASTVARDSVRDCEENNELISCIGDLAVESVYFFKGKGILDLNMYATLPNSKDFDDYSFSWFKSPYKVIYDKLKNEFSHAALIITEKREYKTVDDVLQSNRDIVELFNDLDISHLYCKERSWIPAVKPQSRELYFLEDLKIEQIEKRDVANILKDNTELFSEIFANKDAIWFRKFYALLYDVTSTYAYSKQYEAYKNLAIIRAEDGSMRKASELFFKSIYTPRNIKDAIYVDSLVYSGEKTNSIIEKAKKFIEQVGVRTMSEQIDITSEIEHQGSIGSDDVIITLLEVFEYYEKNGKVDGFENKNIFLARSITKDNELYRTTAKDCCWSEDVAFFYQDDDDVSFILAKDEYDALDGKELNLLYKVFVELGGRIKPTISLTTLSYNHPQWNQLSNIANERYDTCVKKDYTLTGIAHIREIEKEGLFKESLLLWQTVCEDKNVYHHQAQYKANASRPIEYLESTVAYWLRRIRWIPGVNNEFYRPCDITKEMLLPEFRLYEGSVFLENLGFGDKTKAPKDLALLLSQSGIKLSPSKRKLYERMDSMTDEEAESFIRKLEVEDKKKQTFSETLAAENKEQISVEDDDIDDYGRDYGISNVEKRQSQQERDFEEGLEQPKKAYKSWHYSYLSKTSAMEKQFVQSQYKGKCQICGRTPIVKSSGKPYFEAINIINTSKLSNEYMNSLESGWNTLSLCPNCAAEYRYCAKNLDSLEEEIEKTNIQSQENKLIELTITLKNQPTTITFTPKHFLALQSAFKIFRKHEQEDDDN